MRNLEFPNGQTFLPDRELGKANLPTFRNLVHNQ